MVYDGSDVQLKMVIVPRHVCWKVSFRSLDIDLLIKEIYHGISCLWRLPVHAVWVISMSTWELAAEAAQVSSML